MTKIISAFSIAFYILVFSNVAHSRDNINCGNIYADAGNYGPFDYTVSKNRREKLPVVEQYHFTPNVRALISGSTQSSPHQDLDYVLRKFPNHHQALYAMSKLLRRDGSDQVIQIKDIYTSRCYFERALKMNSNDSVTWLIYGIDLHKRNKMKDAEEKYKRSIAINDKNPESYYNIGLLYYSMKKYEQSFENAKKAYDLGFPLLGLKNKLSKKGFKFVSNAKN